MKLSRPPLLVTALAVLAGALSPVAPADAQEPAGDAFRVNTYTTGFQGWSAVAAAASGDFVVAWTTIDGSGPRHVSAQRYDARALRLGTEFRVSAGDAGEYPAIVRQPAGDFTIVWNEGTEIRAQRYATDGSAIGSELVLATPGIGQNPPAAAAMAGGTFVVVWRLPDVRGRRFDASGSPLGAEFDLGAVASQPDVAVATNGDFVVVATTNPGFDIVARCFDASGSPKGPAFVANAYTTGQQTVARVAADAQGHFVVVWMSQGQDGSGLGVIGRRFDGGCNALGPETVVNTQTAADQWLPDVAADPAGDVVVAWTGSGAPNPVLGRRISSSGAFRGAEFAIQSAGGPGPVIASGAPGAFSVIWQDLSTGGSFDVAGRLLSPLGARPMAVDGSSGSSSDGNGVMEPGEAVRVAPAWFNAIEAPVAADGVLSGLTGPSGAGVSYAITDPGASYGAIAPGATLDCVPTGDCYALEIVQAGARPVQHWDAAFIETLEPAALGQAKPWTLHLGDSFGDVPRGNPYYRFIETLLHAGVTTGCSAGSYCPSPATSREQMPVFVLRAKEGPAYSLPACTFSPFTDVPPSSPYCPYIVELFSRGVVTGCSALEFCPTAPVTREQMAVFVLRTLDPALNPPACAPPNMFADVLETSPFCRWIEELARRGIVTGCGGGNYCPSQPVTREQMAVFLTAGFGLTLYGP